MTRPRRWVAGLGRVASVVFSACVVLPAFAQRSADLPRSEVRAEYHSRLLFYRMSDILALEGLHDTPVYQEFKSGSSPTIYDSNTNGVPDGWDTYSATLIKGDVNGDGVISSADLTTLDNILAQGAYHVTPVTFTQADLNNDGVLDQIDRQGLLDLLDGRPQVFLLKPKAN